MRAEDLREIMHSQPFRPFTIHMADGRSFYIPHPDFIATSESGRTTIVFDTNDRLNILDRALMTELEVHPPDEQAA